MNLRNRHRKGSQCHNTVEEVKGACQAENGFAAAEELTRIFAEAGCEELTDTHMYALCGQN